MNLLLLLAIAVPLSCCLGFLSLLAFLGVMTLGAVINVIAITRSGAPIATDLHVNEHTAVVAHRALRFGFSVAAYLLLAFFVAIVVQSLASWLFD